MRFSPAEMTLRDGSGKVVSLRRQSAQVLKVLVDNQGVIVSKQELIDRVWGKIAVTDDSLNQCISDIRKAIGDTNRTTLQTHARKGYMLNVGAESTRAHTPHANAVPGRRIAALTVFIVLGIALWTGLRPSQTPATRLPVVAVLAFDDLSAKPDRGFLSDAISEGIIVELARFAPFSTIAHNSSFAFRERPLDFREIGQKLGADYIVEGSQQKHGENLQVTVQLIDASDNTHIWAETYFGTLDELFAFQADIVRKVASTAGGKLAAYLPQSGDRDTVSAVHLATQGLVHLRTSGTEAKEKSRPYFEAAIKADPDAANGYLGMGFYFRVIALNAVDDSTRQQALRNAKQMADKALEIAPENYLTHYLQGHLHVLDGDISLARAKYDKAKKLNPSFSNVFVGGSSTKIYTGDTEGAIADIQHAMRIDPLHPEWFHGQLAWAYWAAGDCEAANEAFQNMAKVPPVTQKSWAAVQSCLGDQEAAGEAMEEYLASRPGATLKKEREKLADIWLAKGQLVRWLDDLKAAGMPD